MPTLTEIYEALEANEGKVVQTPQPPPFYASGGGPADPTKDDLKKAITDFQKMMSTDVEALAAQEAADNYDTVQVRGRRMIVSKDKGQARVNGIVAACLYAANNPGIDSVFQQLDIKANFIYPNGDVRKESFINPTSPAAPPAPAPKPAEAEKRSILLDEPEQPPSKENLFVAIADLDGRVRSFGVIVKLAVETHGGKEFHLIRNIVTRYEYPVREDYLTPITNYEFLKKSVADMTIPHETVNESEKSG